MLHRIAVALARVALRLPALGGRLDEQRRPVRFLLMHAWGMGGTIRATLHLAGQLAARHEVEILSVVRLTDEPFFPFPPGVRVTAIDDRRPHAAGGLAHRLLAARRGLLLHPADHISDKCTLWTDVQMLRALRGVRSGVVIGTRPALNFLALEAARRRGVVAVGEEHMNLSAHPAGLRAAMRRSYPALDAVVVLTESDRRDYALALPAATVRRIPNAVPAMAGPPSPLTGRVVLAAGRLRRQKAFDRLIRAFAPIARSHPDWTLRICGSGGKRAELEALVADLGMQGRVELPGRVRNMAREMRRASLLAISSRFEGFPMVILEAMSLGVPIVSFDCPTGPAELIDHERSGLLVPEGDIEALSRAMLRLVDDESIRRRFGAAAHAAAMAYTPEAVGARWEALLGELATDHDRSLAP